MYFLLNFFLFIIKERNIIKIQIEFFNHGRKLPKPIYYIPSFSSKIKKIKNKKTSNIQEVNTILDKFNLNFENDFKLEKGADKLIKNPSVEDIVFREFKGIYMYKDEINDNGFNNLVNKIANELNSLN